MLSKSSLRVNCDNNMSSKSNAGYDNMMLSKDNANYNSTLLLRGLLRK